MNHPTYLWKNNRGIYFFRTRIPKQFLEYFIGTEIKKSLKTDSLRLAVKLARAYRVELDKEMDKLKPGIYSAFEVTLKGGRTVTLPSGETKFITGEIKRNLSSHDEDTTKHKDHILNQLDREAKHQAHEAREEALFNAKLSAIATPASTSTPATPSANTRQAALSDIIDEFVKFKVTSGNWNTDPKNTTHSQGVARLNLLLEIIGNKQSNELSVLDAIKVEETLPHIPKNPNKGLLATLPNLQAKIDTDETTHPRLDKRTTNKYWELFKALAKFAKQKKYLESDIVGDCVGIKFSKKDGKKAQWRKFTDDDLQNIFNGHIYQPVKRPRSRNHDYHFWLPLLAAFAGGRINELAQLLLTDIKQYQGIWYIEITDEDEEGRKVDGKDVKSEAGKRKVPLHSALIELGFLDFINQPRSGDFSNMVFTSGLANHEAKKWGKNASNWFNGYEGRGGYKQMCGISGDDKKVFHSFRKSFAANLGKHASIERIAQLIGHEQENETTFIYVGEFEIPTLKEVIDKLDYKLDLSHVSYETFKSKYSQSNE